MYMEDGSYHIPSEDGSYYTPSTGICPVCGGMTIDDVCGDICCGEPWYYRLRTWLSRLCHKYALVTNKHGAFVYHARIDKLSMWLWPW
jgi:hypothetical protein